MNTLFFKVAAGVVIFGYTVHKVYHIFREIVILEFFKHFIFVRYKKLGYSEETTAMEGESFAPFNNRLTIHHKILALLGVIVVKM